jgi:hypothetical protein
LTQSAPETENAGVEKKYYIVTSMIREYQFLVKIRQFCTLFIESGSGFVAKFSMPVKSFQAGAEHDRLLQ